MENKTSNIYYIQVDHRFEGDYSWEELVVCSSTPEEAIKLVSLDTMNEKRIHIELIGVALNRDHGVICLGDHDGEASFELLKTASSKEEE